MNETPLISVNMPCYNCSKYIKQSIESVLNQTINDFELIIVDDGSEDNSVEIIKSYNDSRIKLFENGINKGITFTRNRAVENSVGKYIAILDSDDIAYRDRFEKQLAFFQLNPEYAMVGSWFDLIDENGFSNGEVARYLIDNKYLKTQLFFGNYFGQSTIMLKRKVFDDFSYNDDYIQAEDYFLWVQIAQKYNVANLRESLVQYRVHKSSITQRKLAEQEDCVKKIFEYQISLLNLQKNDTINLHYKLLRYKYNAFEINWITLKKILDWIILLKKQNSKFKIYDQSFFCENLKTYWKCYFKYSYLHGIKAIPFLLSSFNNELTIKRRFRLLFKCIESEIKLHF